MPHPPTHPTSKERTMDQETLTRDYRPVYPLRHGLMIYAHHDDFGLDTGLPEKVVVAGYCVGTDEFYILDSVPLAGLVEWYDRDTAIQDALPDLLPEEREFLKSRTHPSTFTPPS
jgi:hypothetical protein